MEDTFPILNPAIAAYLDGIQPTSDPILREMEAYGIGCNFPCLGPLCSRMLYMLASMTSARRIFELGSGFGYTMFWMAKALPSDGVVIGTEYEQSNIDLANEYFRRGGLIEKTDLRKGDALDILESESGPFDLIYNDIDKHDYPRVIELAKLRLRTGGLLISDNALWSGKVTDQAITDNETVGVRAYNDTVSADPDFATTIIPIRDGLSVSLKTGSM